MAKKAVKKAVKKAAKKAVKKSVPQKKSLSEGPKGVKKIATAKLKKASHARKLEPCCDGKDPILPVGRLYPNDIRQAIETGWASEDPGQPAPFRDIPDLLSNYSSLTCYDVERLRKYDVGSGGLDALFSIEYKKKDVKYEFSWRNFGISWDNAKNRAIINCVQQWPSSSLKKSSKKAKRPTLDTYLGDIEISITWPCEDNEQPDPRTTQSIKLTNVQISPYQYPPPG